MQINVNSPVRWYWSTYFCINVNNIALFVIWPVISVKKVIGLSKQEGKVVSRASSVNDSSAPLFCRNEDVIPSGRVQRDECASRSVRPNAEWHDKHTSHRDASCQSPRGWRNYSNSRSGFRVCVCREREHHWVTVELSARARCALVLRFYYHSTWTIHDPWF